MTLQERAKMATEARQRRTRERTAELRHHIAQGRQVKWAAYEVGVSNRTASRYLRGN